MNFEEYVARFQEEFGQTDVSSLPSFLAIQINVTGENGGSFYIEVKDGVLTIAPYEYLDRQVLISISMQNLDKLVHGKLDPVLAFTLGKLKAEGDLGKALELKKLIHS